MLNQKIETQSKIINKLVSKCNSTSHLEHKKVTIDKKIEKQMNKISAIKNEIKVINPIDLHQTAIIKNGTVPVAGKQMQA